MGQQNGVGVVDPVERMGDDEVKLSWRREEVEAAELRGDDGAHEPVGLCLNQSDDRPINWLLRRGIDYYTPGSRAAAEEEFDEPEDKVYYRGEGKGWQRPRLDDCRYQDDRASH